MRAWFPSGFLKSFLVTANVSSFLGTESRQETRKLLFKPVVPIEDDRFPLAERFSRQETFGFLNGFLRGRRGFPVGRA
jgi:hypothetical protein